ncbi:Uncharacterised protein [Shigella sonnei]|nr:Uncharacterised protein [Shigella sonnei]
MRLYCSTTAPESTMTASMDEPPPPPAEASIFSSNELQSSAANKMTCSTAEIIIARLSLSFCSVAFDTLGFQKLFACYPLSFKQGKRRCLDRLRH